MKLKSLLEDGDYGSILFDKVIGWHKGREPDTPMEAMFWRAIELFIEGEWEGTSITGDFKYAIDSLMKAKKDYPKELIFKGSGPLWRGLKYPAEDIYMNVPIKVLKNGKVRKIGYNQYVEIDYNYKPRSKVQSCTTDIHTAQLFAEGTILEAKIPKSQLLFNTKFINQITKVILGDVEDEVLRVGGPMKCKMLISPWAWKEIKGWMDNSNR